MIEVLFKSLPVLIPVLAVISIVTVLLLCRKRKSPKAKDAPRETQSATKQEMILSQGIRKTAGHYDGLYEGLYLAAQNPENSCTDAYQEWCDRASQNPDQAFREAFASLFQKSDIEDRSRCLEKHRKLLELINAAGILRDRDNGETAVADDPFCKNYYELTGQKPQTGVTYQIIKSAWIMDGTAVEYGMVMRINQ